MPTSPWTPASSRPSDPGIRERTKNDDRRTPQARTGLRGLPVRGNPASTATATADSWATDAVLVRPDGCAVWSAQGTPTDAEALRAALLRWFGSEAV
ncbi:hypothetical protein [Microtetraspora malaysiensis]|uniref:aromatic-ring hydroxylase C-terminal domain-containing protein n=1 Tax=Microtetraspora malaysiensis TaxID=161358 RepID=UPI003D912A59